MRRYTAAEARALLLAVEPGTSKLARSAGLVTLRLAARDLAATVEALEAELAEARLCLLAEAGDPGGAVGLHEWWRYRMGGWCLTHTGEYEDAGASLWRDRQEGSADPAPLRWQHLFEWGEGGHPVPAGLSIRDAMRWVESQVLPKEAAEVSDG